MERGEWGRLCIRETTHLFSRLFPFFTPSSCAIVPCRSCCVGLQHTVSFLLTPQVSSSSSSHMVAWALPFAWQGWEAGTCDVPATGQAAHWGHFHTLSKSKPGNWSRSLSCFPRLPKTCSKSFIIYYCSHHIVFVLGQEPKMLAAAFEWYMKPVSRSLYSYASVLHRFRHLFNF